MSSSVAPYEFRPSTKQKKLLKISPEELALEDQEYLEDSDYVCDEEDSDGDNDDEENEDKKEEDSEDSEGSDDSDDTEEDEVSDEMLEEIKINQQKKMQQIFKRLDADGDEEMN